jgi:ribonucleoside-diphosphate reductase alpha chain
MTVFVDSFSEDVWYETYKNFNDACVDDTFKRVAKAVASVEETESKKIEWENKFFDMLSDFKCTAGGRTYANAGTEYHGTTLLNCFSGDTKVLTDNGSFSIAELSGKTVNVLNQNNEFVPATFSQFGEQELWEVIFSNNEKIYTTENHDWLVTHNTLGKEKVLTKHLLNRIVPLNYCKTPFVYNNDEYRNGVQHGLVFGDGNLYTDFSTGEKFCIINQFGDSRHLIVDYFDGFKTGLHKGDKEGIYYRNGLPPEYKEFPEQFSEYSLSYLRGFLAGLIGSDGCVDSKGSVMFHSASLTYIELVKDLCGYIGLPTLSIRKEREINPFNPTKKSELWKLSFVKLPFKLDKKLIIKNSHRIKMDNSPVSFNTVGVKVVSVQPLGIVAPVFCCNEENTHTFTVGNSLFLTGNCFVSPRTVNDIDSLDKILDDVKNQAFTLKSEGGWGQNFSWIRPRGSFIHGIGVESPGAVKYMEIYDKTSDIITAGAGKKSNNIKAKKKIRKGAMMAVLDCWHPDVVEFITAKQHPGRLTKFNMSVNCTDDFMEKVINCDDDNWDLIFPDTTFEKYSAEWDGDINTWKQKNYPIKIHKTISVKYLWNLIMESTYNRAEPGVLFLDRANDFNPLYYGEHIYSTNPCGEQTLAPGGVCCLGSINITQFINDTYTDIDYNKLKKYAKYMVRFLDNVNEYSSAPLPEYIDSMRNKRRIGIGIMGWGSSLFMMGIKFASERSSIIRDKLMKTLAQTVYEASIDLAIEKGMFTYCDPIKHAEGKFVKSLDLSSEYMEKLKTTGIRNSSLLSIQPTGNSSIFANIVSGGLEPIFMPEYIRTVIVTTTPDEISHLTPKWYEGEWCETDLFKFIKEGDEELLSGIYNGTTYKIDKNRGLLKEVECKDYSVRKLMELGKWNPDAEYVVTALNGLTSIDHLNDLIGFTKYVDSAVSKTVNLPHEYTFEDFKDIYLTAYKSGHIKGITTYRSGTMATVLSAKETENNGYEEEIILDNVKMLDSSDATMKILKAEGRKWYITIVWNETKTRPFALFVYTNHHEKSVTTHDAVDKLLWLAEYKEIPNKFIAEVKEKIDSDNNATKITRVISLLLRHGVAIKNIVATLNKIDNVFVGSFLFQITKYLSSFIKNGEKVENEKCLECGSENVVFQEGCKVCSNCGNSKCG